MAAHDSNIQLSEWAPGSGPVSSQALTYGSDYRLAQVQTQYAGDDGWSTPYTAADSQIYPLSEPVPGNRRVKQQTFAYDFRGNFTQSTDDLSVFWDRSLATVTTTGGTDQLAQAVSTDNQAQAAMSYDAAGNMSLMQVFTFGNGLEEYDYGWDELGRLSTASRGAIVTAGGAIAERFTYDASGNRVSIARTTNDGSGTQSPTQYTVNVFDSLVLENAAFPDSSGANYEHDDATEHLYLGAAGELLGHVFRAQTSMPSASGAVHMFMPMGDRLGSTSFVIDHDTGEVVEATTYQAYGAVDSDFRPARWSAFREDVRYASHWDDAEVGLVYMNARYYSPQLGRFISPDPLTIHGLAGDPNPARYVDPSGLDDGAPGDCSCFLLFFCSCGSNGGGQSDDSDDNNNGSAGTVYSGGGGGGYNASGYPPNPPPPPPQVDETRANGAATVGPTAWSTPAPGQQITDDQEILAAQNRAFAEQRRTLAALLGPYQTYEDIKDRALIQLAQQAVVGPAGEILGVVVGGAAEGAVDLAARAAQVHEVLDPIAQGMRTTAALDTSAGRILAGGARDLTPAQRAALLPGEIAGSLPGAHAEVTAIQTAQQLGATPQSMAVTRAICPACAAAIEASGGTFNKSNHRGLVVEVGGSDGNTSLRRGSARSKPGTASSPASSGFRRGLRGAADARLSRFLEAIRKRKRRGVEGHPHAALGRPRWRSNEGQRSAVQDRRLHGIDPA